ncbi:MAG: DNA repair protein RecO [Planctomycetaceae bacterium]|jgi:DNA repair protein RecO (recombination protein O)|nr:DNA repair protein RecO [Planctomycetaceae bacterium]
MENDEAVVIHSVDFSETSLIVTLFTKRFGKIEAIAKGGRRLKSPFESALDILTRINVTFIQKKNDALDILTESQLIRRFHVTQNNLHGLYAAYYIAELVNLFTERNLPNSRLYNLTSEKLCAFEKSDSINYHIAQFEFQLLYENGTKPVLSYCAECGTKIEITNPNQLIPFRQAAGGVICNKCVEKNRKFQQHYTLIKNETLKILKHFETEINNKINNKQCTNLQLSNKSINETLNLLNNCINYQLGSQPRTQKYLKHFNYTEHTLEAADTMAAKQASENKPAKVTEN